MPSGREWQGAQSGQGTIELGFPRPALWQMQCEVACRAGDPSGQGEEPPPEGLGGHHLLAQTDARCPAGEVVGHHQADTNSAELWIPSSTVKQLEPTPTPVPPPARVLTVNKIADTDDGGCDADCSLREAIAAADSGDTIIIPGGTYTLTLGSQLTIDKSLTFSGAGSEDTVIQAAASSADATSRVLMIEGDNSTVTISDVTIRHGNAREAHGGGIFNGATLTLTHTTISSNIATKSGGGFINIGQATIIGSFITGNTSAFWGGGIRNAGTLTISNSTVSGNSAATFGGGINNTSDATFTIVNSTITDNDAGSGGGGIQNSGTLSLTNTIIANNTNRDCSGNPTSLGHNLDSDGTCGLNGAGDKTYVPNVNLFTQARNLVTTPPGEQAGVNRGPSSVFWNGLDCKPLSRTGRTTAAPPLPMLCSRAAQPSMLATRRRWAAAQTPAPPPTSGK